MKAPKATPSPNDRGYTSGLDERLFFFCFLFEKGSWDVPGLPIESQLDGQCFIYKAGYILGVDSTLFHPHFVRFCFFKYLCCIFEFQFVKHLFCFGLQLKT